MANKKVKIIIASTFVLLAQLSTECLGQVSRNVYSAASSLRNLVRERPLTDVEQFLQSYLEEAPELLPDIFWEDRSGFGVQLPLYDIVHRNTAFDDHEHVLVSLVEALREAYQKKGFSSAEASQKAVEWLLENDTKKSRFLEYCVFSCKLTKDKIFHSQVCSKKNRRKITKMTIEILNKYAGIDVSVAILSSTTETGFPLSAHIADL